MLNDLLVQEESTPTDFEKRLDSASNYSQKLSCLDGKNLIYAMYLGKSTTSEQELHGCVSNSSCFYKVKENGLKICSYLL